MTELSPIRAALQAVLLLPVVLYLCITAKT